MKIKNTTSSEFAREIRPRLDGRKDELINASGELLFFLEGDKLSPLAQKVKDSNLLEDNFSIYDFSKAVIMLEDGYDPDFVPGDIIFERVIA